jgi:hypothetical protein
MSVFWPDSHPSLVWEGQRQASVLDPEPHESENLDPDADHQSDKLDPVADPHLSDELDPDPHHFAYDEPKCLEYGPI